MHAKYDQISSVMRSNQPSKVDRGYPKCLWKLDKPPLLSRFGIAIKA